MAHLTFFLFFFIAAARPAAAALFPPSAFSKAAAGTTGAAFLKIPTGARFVALGETSSAGSQGAESVFWNPAGLGRSGLDSSPEMLLGFNNMLETSYSGSAAYLHPTSIGVFGAGILYFSQSAQTAYTPQGDAAGTFKPYDVAVSLAYAHRIGILLFGATLKLIHSTLNEVSGSGAAADLGVQMLHITDAGEGPVDLGFNVSNLGMPLKLGAQGDPLPFNIRTGFLWHTAPFLSAGLDLNLPVDGDPYVSVGLEASAHLGVQRLLKASLRAGYSQRYTRGASGLTGMSLGAGLDAAPFRVDYAWSPFGDLGSGNTLTLAYRF